MNMLTFIFFTWSLRATDTLQHLQGYNDHDGQVNIRSAKHSNNSI